MRRVLLPVVAAFSLTSATQAADLASAVIAPVAAAINTGGWYLRGDVGYVMPTRPTVNGLLPGGLIRTFEDERLGKSFLVGAGVGYKFNNWFRADATVEWRKSSTFHATNSGTNYVNGYSDERARFSARTFMVNGYIDLGSWSGFTPYVGAGVGVAAKDVRNWQTQVFCYNALCTPSGPTATLPNSSKTGFAWALMAGTAVQLTDALALDIGYRFINLGGVTTNSDPFGVAAKVDDVKVNEVKVGLRYMFR
ncbi:outer membrane protein [Terrarubrum flagellatum]|uniref:outer membrane protein n=1 Tax=Terrirubrum flagellatum TaxID=2895980 RepID=UPI00314544DC